MGTLDRLILQELVGPFLFGIMAFTVLLVAGNLLFKIADLVIQRGVSLGVVVRLFLYYLPGVVVMTIPMGSLLAALLGFGRLSANVEIVALKSAGVAFQRVVRPVIWASLLVSLGSLVLNETLVPLAERAAVNLLRYEVMQETPPLFKERIFLKEEKDGHLKRVIYINRMRPRSGKMADILVQEFEEDRLSRIIAAPRGEWVRGEWWIEDGKVFEVDPGGKVRLLFTFRKQGLQLHLNPKEVETQSLDPQQMNLLQMRQAIRRLQEQGADATRLRVLAHLRMAVPWASVVLALVGAAAGSRPQRSSSSVGLGLSIVIVFFYYVILSFCQSLGEASYLPAVVAAWFPNLVFLVLGGFLVRRAN